MVIIRGALVAALAAAPALGQEAGGDKAPRVAPEGGTFSVTFENDIFGGSDRDYTNGIRLDYISGRGDLPLVGRVVRDNLDWLTEAEDWYMTFALGQSMFTPADITLAAPEPGDRPYAGFLYASVGIAADTGDTLDVLALEFGVVGPASMAEETQTLVHEIIGAPEPRGWDTQLENEFAFRALYESKYQFEGDLLVEPFGLEVDFAPHWNVSLGTIDTSAGVGATVRLGQDLGDDYGPPRIRPAVSSPGFFRDVSGASWYIFGGIEGRAVARNLFIEGNTFGGVDGVDPKRFVADLQAGAAVQFRGFEVAYTHVFRTQEYDGQDSPAQFGSVNLRFRF